MSIYSIKIHDKEYPVKNMSDFSFDEYNELNDILQYTDIKEQYYLLLQLFTDIPHETVRSIKDPFIVDFKAILSAPIKVTKIPTKFINDLIVLDNITIGKFIDMDYFMTNNVEQKIEKIVALMYMSNDITSEELEVMKNKVHSDMNIGIAIKVFEMFTSFRSNFYKQYEGLFQMVDNDPAEPNDDDDIEVENEEDYDDTEDDTQYTSYGLLEFVYFLANDRYMDIDNILEDGLYKVFNYLGWKKIQNEKEMARQKAEAAKHKTY